MADTLCRYCGEPIVFRCETSKSGLSDRCVRVYHVPTGWPCWRKRHDG